METVRLRLAVLTLPLAASAFAPPPIANHRRHLPALALPAKEWRPARESAAALAKRVDLRLAGLRNTIVSSLATLDLPTGNGEARMRSIIRSPDSFEIQTVRIGTKKYEEVRKTIWRLNNGRLTVLLDAGNLPRALGGYAQLPQPLVIAFRSRFDDILFRGVRGAKPLSRLVSAAKTAGWTVVAESNPRLVPPTTRLRFVAPGGKVRYGVDVDDARGLVSQIEVDDSRSARTYRVLWSAAWGVKRTPLTPQDIATFDPARPGG